MNIFLHLITMLVNKKKLTKESNLFIKNGVILLFQQKYLIIQKQEEIFTQILNLTTKEILFFFKTIFKNKRYYKYLSLVNNQILTMLAIQGNISNIQSNVILIQSVDSLNWQTKLSPLRSGSTEIPKFNSHSFDRKLEQSQVNVTSNQIKKCPKEDYQKNIAINVVKCCIRSILDFKYQQKLKKICRQRLVDFNNLITFVEPILRQVVLSLGNLKILLTTGNKEQKQIKRAFTDFLKWFLRHRYLKYLLLQGKMMVKEKYIDYKNKYILYLLKDIFETNQEESCQINVKAI